MTIEAFINALESYPATIAAIAAVIAAIGVLAAFIANIQAVGNTRIVSSHNSACRCWNLITSCIFKLKTLVGNLRRVL